MEKSEGNFEPLLIAFRSTAVEVVKLFLPQMKNFSKNLSPLLNTIEKVTNNYQPQIEALSKSLSPAMVAIANITDLYGPQMLVFLQSAKKFEDFNLKLINQHKTSELILPPHFANLALPKVYDLFKDDNKLAIEVYFDYFQNSDNIEALLSSWSDFKFYNDRLPILKDALYANLEEKYTLSIPVFLAQLEGIVCEILEVKDHRKAKGKLNSIKFEDEVSNYPFATPQLIADILINQIFQSSENHAEEMNYPNRHSILHGNDKYYYDNKYSSLRCILVLDSLRTEEFVNFKKN